MALAPGSSTSILTQAANKAYRGKKSVQRASFRIGEGAFLEYLPHHLIPYVGLSYRWRTALHLAPASTLVTWDAFDALRGRTIILQDGIPKAIDGLGLTGGSEHFGGGSSRSPGGRTPRSAERFARSTRLGQRPIHQPVLRAGLDG